MLFFLTTVLYWVSYFSQQPDQSVWRSLDEVLGMASTVVREGFRNDKVFSALAFLYREMLMAPIQLIVIGLFVWALRETREQP